METYEELSLILTGSSLTLFSGVILFGSSLNLLGFMIFIPMFLGGIGMTATGIQKWSKFKELASRVSQFSMPKTFEAA